MFGNHRLGLGTMMFGWRTSLDESLKILEFSLEKNIKFIDTSVSYGRGASHKFLGSCIKELNCRKDLFLATKIGGVSSRKDNPNSSSFQKNNFTKQVELSLKQLEVDCIDLVQIHNPIHEDFEIINIINEFEQLFASGKVRFIGLSNHSFNQAQHFHSLLPSRLSETCKLTNQLEVNLLCRNAIEQFPSENDIDRSPIIAWGPLSSGLLTTSTVKNNSIPPRSRLAVGKEFISKNQLLCEKKTQKIFNNLTNLSQELNIDITLLAFGWVMNLKKVDCVLAGPSSLAQLKHIMEVLKLPKSVLDKLSKRL